MVYLYFINAASLCTSSITVRSVALTEYSFEITKGGLIYSPCKSLSCSLSTTHLDCGM